MNKRLLKKNYPFAKFLKTFSAILQPISYFSFRGYDINFRQSRSVGEKSIKNRFNRFLKLRFIIDFLNAINRCVNTFL